MKYVLKNEADCLIATNKSVEEINEILGNETNFFSWCVLPSIKLTSGGFNLNEGRFPLFRNVYVTYYPSEKETVLAIRTEIGLFHWCFSVVFSLFDLILLIGCIKVRIFSGVLIFLFGALVCFLDVRRNIKFREIVRLFFYEELKGNVTTAGIQ